MTHILRQHGRTTLGVHPHPIVEAIRARETFVAGALHAEELASVEGVSARDWWFGARWDNDERTVFYNAAPSYVVFSYRTPIAWWSPTCGWFVSDERYSATTSRHQSFVRRAVP